MDIWRHIYWISFLFYSAVQLKRGCKLNNVKAGLFKLLSNGGHDLNFMANERFRSLFTCIRDISKNLSLCILKSKDQAGIQLKAKEMLNIFT